MMPPPSATAGELSAGVCEYAAGDNNLPVSLPGLSLLVLINWACDREKRESATTKRSGSEHSRTARRESRL